MSQQQFETDCAAERHPGVEHALLAEIDNGSGDRIGDLPDRERLPAGRGRPVPWHVDDRDAVALREHRNDVLPEDRRRAERRPQHEEGRHGGADRSGESDGGDGHGFSSLGVTARSTRSVASPV